MAQNKIEETLVDWVLGDNPLPEQFLDKIKRIETQRVQLELYTRDLELLQRRFNVEKSLLGRVASSFSALSWWQQGILGIVIGGAFALLGLAISTAWVIALPIIAFSFYVGIAYLFNEYAASDINRFNQLTEGIVEREAEMKKTVLELQETENELYELIEKLKTFGQNHSDVVDRFNDQAYLLTDHVQRYKEVVTQFEQLKIDYQSRAINMQTTESEFAERMNQTSDALYQQIERIKTNAGEVERATQRLHNNVVTLKEESLTITEEGTPLLKGFFDEVLDDFHFRTEEDERRDEEELAQQRDFLQRSKSHSARIGETLNYFAARVQRQQTAIQQNEDATLHVEIH